jgi:hypothetical protein
VIKFLDIDIVEGSSTKLYWILCSPDDHVQQPLVPDRLVVPTAVVSCRIDSQALHRTSPD